MAVELTLANTSCPGLLDQTIGVGASEQGTRPAEVPTCLAHRHRSPPIQKSAGAAYARHCESPSLWPVLSPHEAVEGQAMFY